MSAKTPLTFHPPVIRTDDASQQKIEYTTCYMCACRCGIKVTMQEGKVRFIQGNRDHPVNQGVLCAKGSAGIMKQYSPAKLKAPMLRKSGSERGSGEFETISWDRALSLLTERLARIRSTDPKRLAFFTGRDQMQALTGLWAQQFGTPNWAAHGGFCSVNMAAAGLVFDRLFVLGVRLAGLGAGRIFPALGRGRRSLQQPDQDWSRQAQAQWREICFGQSGSHRLFGDRRRMGADSPGHRWLDGAGDCSCIVAARVVRCRNFWFARPMRPVWSPANPALPTTACSFAMIKVRRWSSISAPACRPFRGPVCSRRCSVNMKSTACPVGTVMSMLVERYCDPQYSPAAVAERCGVAAEVIERIALEMAKVAFEEVIELPIAWTDVWGNQHASCARSAGCDVCDAWNLGAFKRLSNLPFPASDPDAAGRAGWAG